MPRPLSMHGATSDFTAYGVKISLLKAFESNFKWSKWSFWICWTLKRLKVRFKTAWQTCVMKGGIWSWRGASGPSIRCPGRHLVLVPDARGGGNLEWGIWSCYTGQIGSTVEKKIAQFCLVKPLSCLNDYMRDKMSHILRPTRSAYGGDTTGEASKFSITFRNRTCKSDEDIQICPCLQLWGVIKTRSQGKRTRYPP